MVVRSLFLGLILLGVSEMTIGAWFIGVVLFWIVARFTIMKYENLNTLELAILLVLSVAPYVNFIMAGLFIFATIIHLIQKKKGNLEWNNGQFVWVKPICKKEDS